MADIIYTLGSSVYLNLTNKCPCNCAFCIRSKGDAVGSAKNLWFDEEPDFDEIKKAIDEFDCTRVDRAVFCGYGEPCCAFDKLIKTAKYLKEINPDIKLRINTNGLSDLINERPTAKELCENIDIISVSLNAPNSEQFDKITRNIYPHKAFDAMLKFTRECVEFGNEVHMSVVDVIGDEAVEECKKICNDIGARFILRSYAKGR